MPSAHSTDKGRKKAKKHQTVKDRGGDNRRDWEDPKTRRESRGGAQKLGFIETSRQRSPVQPLDWDLGMFV